MTNNKNHNKMPNYEEFNTNNNYYYNSDDDTNDEYNIYINEEDNVIYNPEEESTTKYNLINYEIYNPNIHGKNSSNLYSQLLVGDRYKYSGVESIENMLYHGENVNLFVFAQISEMSRCINHPIIRNFMRITARTSGKLEIAECIYLEDGVMVAILKTFWLKLIQRRWRNVFRERERIKKLRMRVASFVYREMNGEWPLECKIIPGLRGMLNTLFYDSPSVV